MPIKFLVLGEGGLGFLERGGGSDNFIFMGVGIFPSFGEENSLSLTEFYGSRGELCEQKLGEFAFAHK